MIWFLASAHAAMPAGLDLDDVGRWDDAADRLLDLPEGCYEWVGDATWAWDVGRFGGSQGDAVFAGRTQDGKWGSILLRPLGEDRREDRDLPRRVYDVREARFAPLVGSLVGARVTVQASDGRTSSDAGMEENAEASNVLRDALAKLGAGSSSVWVEWDDARSGVVLHRALAIDGAGGEDVAVTAFFPGGGTVPTALDLDFPDHVHTGLLPRWTISNAEVHLRGVAHGDEAFPSSEAFSFDFSVFGWSFHGAQTIRYTHAKRCPAPAAEPAPEGSVPAPVDAPVDAPAPAAP